VRGVPWTADELAAGWAHDGYAEDSYASAATFEDGNYGEYGEDGGANPGEDAQPMELGAINNGGQQSGPPHFGLSEQQRLLYADANRCFCCHKVGHHHTNCRNPLATQYRTHRQAAQRSH